MPTIHTDIVIIGAGIAGLWLHHQLNNNGYHTTLLEKRSIGGKQTLSSQGIIHGGTKYALNGALSGAASAIGDMPNRWKACLEGHGELNLKATQKLADYQLMWSTQTLSSKIISFFSSKALSSRITPVKPSELTDFFSHNKFKGNLYQLNEPVLDTTSLTKNLSSTWAHRILANTGTPELTLSSDNSVETITLNKQHQIKAQHIILTSGEGNESLLKQLTIKTPAMQRRPLKMVLAKSKQLPKLYAHCIGTNTKPLATITTHTHSDGDNIWYIGGNIAEEGTNMDDSVLINTTTTLFQKIMPWYDLTNIQWATHAINRAEPAQNNLLRPDTAFMKTMNNISVAWPTKLALTPDLSDQACATIKKMIAPKTDSALSDNQLASLSEYYPYNLSPPLWETLDYSYKL